MSGVKIIEINKEKVLDFADEGIRGILLGEDSHASYSVAIVPVGGRQRRHVQQRPDNGTEVMFFFSGRFAFIADGAGPDEYDVAEGGPVLVVCPSGVASSIENRGDTEVRLFSVFAPPFLPGEIEYLD